MSTFGFSISGALDLDNNQYPDLLVGAYETNNAVFFRSRPVIHLDANLTFETPSKQIDLENKLVCKLLDNTPVPCTPLNLCVEYTGIGVDLKAGTVFFIGNFLFLLFFPIFIFITVFHFQIFMILFTNYIFCFEIIFFFLTAIEK